MNDDRGWLWCRTCDDSWDPLCQNYRDDCDTISEDFEFTVPGPPVPAVRMTQRSKWRNKQAQRYLGYRESVGWAARAAGVQQFEGPIIVVIDVLLKDRMKRRWDIDNVAKALLDGLNGVAYADDKQITTLTIGVRDTLDEEETHVWIGRAA